jgi:hypothetical protein
MANNPNANISTALAPIWQNWSGNLVYKPASDSGKHFAPDCHDLFRGVGSTSFQHSDFIDRLSGHGTEISAFEKRR